MLYVALSRNKSSNYSNVGLLLSNQHLRTKKRHYSEELTVTEELNSTVFEGNFEDAEEEPSHREEQSQEDPDHKQKPDPEQSPVMNLSTLFTAYGLQPFEPRPEYPLPYASLFIPLTPSRSLQPDSSIMTNPNAEMASGTKDAKEIK